MFDSNTTCLPLQVFCNMLDLAIINARILYQSVKEEKISRRRFIMRLVEDIIEHGNIQSTHACFTQANQSTQPTRQQCQVKLCKGNKSSGVCIKCGKVTCGTCTKTITSTIVCKKC